ncbi:MAG: hypothetical protein IJS45_08210 [Clostridia bacterium]|nr:hypothetical protein [Clostridia bacterium]
MLGIIFGIIGSFVIVKLLWRIITFPFRLIGRMLGFRPQRRRRALDVPMTEYDEFDWWQDNQGF